MQVARESAVRAIVAGAVFMLAACSRQEAIEFEKVSPDGRSRLYLQTHLKLPQMKSVARFEVASGRGITSVKSWQQSDMYVCFVASAWTADSSVVVALFRDCWHGGELVAFDVRKQRSVDPTPVKEILASEIRRQYRLDSSVGDPITWALSTEEARHAFFKMRTP